MTWSDEEPAAQLTEEMILDLVERLRMEQSIPHGTEERPHIVHPRWPNRCIECGQVMER